MIQSQRVDLLIETRDARMPLTSLNPAFEKILDSAGGKGAGLTKRLVVYNKRDLAQGVFEKAIKKSLWIHGQQECLFTDSRNDDDMKNLLETAIRSFDYIECFDSFDRSDQSCTRCCHSRDGESGTRWSG